MKKKYLFHFLFSLILAFSSPVYGEEGHSEHEDETEQGHEEAHSEHGHDDEKEHEGEHSEHGDDDEKEHEGEHSEHGHGEEKNAIELNQEQRVLVEIETYEVQMKAVPQIITAPGTLLYNAYRMTDVSTPMDVIIVERHVKLGEEVEKGQELVTVSSIVLGEAQATYLRLLAEYKRINSESKRLKGLSKQKIVSVKRLQNLESEMTSVRANLRQAKAHLETFGLRGKDVEELRKTIKQLPFGQIILRAKKVGTVVFDNFRLGQSIAAGEMLLQIVDESEIWIEAKIGEQDFTAIKTGQNALIRSRAYPNRNFHASVLLLHHIFDAVTRTAGVRLSAENKGDLLKPGMFVNVEIITGGGKEVLMIPELALQRQGNERIVFVEEKLGHYERREVETKQAVGGWSEIVSGVKKGEKVVVNGAFSLLSELAKSGFEAHNH